MNYPTVHSNFHEPPLRYLHENQSSYNKKKTEMFREQIVINEPHPITLLKRDLFFQNF